MHKTITVKGQEYELQISARRVEGSRYVSMDERETCELYDEARNIFMDTMDSFKMWSKCRNKNLTKTQEQKIDELYIAVADMLFDGKFGTAEEGEK